MKKLITIIAVLFITASVNAQEVQELAVYNFVNAVENVNEETQYVFMSEKSLLVSVTDQGSYNESYVFIPYIDTVEVHAGMLLLQMWKSENGKEDWREIPIE